mmetsp:Transcript_45745/g.108416  ORF Transcript_45745/g.108416 Transcript_45745/m.108416 type:complete len:1782 (-) Transcript_45745:139-5484(-)
MPGFGAVRVWSALVVLLCLIEAGHAAIALQKGDTFSGQFEISGLTDDNYFVLRAHSPQHGAFTWITGLGHAPGWMTHCTPPNSCAGGPLTSPVFGTVNVTGVGACTDANSCTAPPAVQPGTGCRVYGCYNPACGCNIGTGVGCFGRDMRNTIALVQRGSGVGEHEPPSDQSCTFSRKIHNAEMAGASAAIVFNNQPYAAVYMAADSEYTNLTIPAIFLTRDAGLLLWDMIQEAEMTGGVDVSLTNQTENAMRLSIDDVSAADSSGTQQVSGLVEFRLEEMGLEVDEFAELNITNNEMYPYGSFRVQGDYTASGDLTLRPQCERGVDNCDASSTVWLRKPFLLNHGLDAVVPFGLSLQVRSPGDDGVAFEHVRGAVASWDGVVDPGAHVKMRRVPECEAELSFVVDCMPAGEEDEDGQQCLSALDERGYRNFNDLTDVGMAPLFWYCRHSKYCAGDYLTKAALKRLEAQSLPPLAEPCPDGQKHGYMYLGPHDWGMDESLHLCGHGDRSRQPHVCRKLPNEWYFNTSCAVAGREGDCGHHGWFMEGGYIASCTDGADCSVDDSRSKLDLHIKLAQKGQVAFTYTAHGEPFFDYMSFDVNDATVHHTQTWWSTGNFISGVVVVLPPGEHKLTWSWVKDWSLSGGEDKATLHEILITGTPDDATCTDCEPGFCGNGGLAGCVVCPRSQKSADKGSTQCVPCGNSPEGTVYTGPADWPFSGNAATCDWGCTPGFCSSSGGTSRCSETTTCPPGQCCPHRGQCYLPTLEMVEDGEWPITMEMLRNCLDLTPFNAETASKTQNILRGFLDQDGVYPWYNQRVGGQTKGDLITNTLNKILQDSDNAAAANMDQVTKLPKTSDWGGLHGKLIKTMRDTQDADLAYIPPTFYQDVSFFLPWQFSFKHSTSCEGWKGVGCDQLVIQDMNALLADDYQSWFRGQSGWHARPCDCLTCDCKMGKATPAEYVGWTVKQLDVDGTGLGDAFDVFQRWADANAIGDDAGARMTYAVKSGEKVAGRLRTSMRQSAGQFGCSFATRNLGVCQLPPCTDTFCHVKMVLEGPGGEQETLDVPWTVVYHPHGIGSWDKAGEVLCTERSLPPFDRNAACMSNAVTKRYSYGTTAQQSGVEMPMCSDGKLKRGGMEGRWFPVYNPAPSFAPPDFDCDRHGTFQILWNGLHTLGTSERAAAGMVMLDMGSMARTAVLSLRSFEREELALHNVFGEIGATSPDSLMIDLRGNIGGELCHVFELAYLVSNKFKSVQEAQNMLALHLRHSSVMDTLVYTDIVLGENRGATTGWADTCSLTQNANGYQCPVRGSDLRWYYCGNADLCKMGRFDCPACPKVTSNTNDEWSLPFRPRCANQDGLLKFDPLSQCTVKERGYNILQTQKICPHCSGDDCEARGLCGFDKVNLHILTDGRCVGACAIFVQLMEAADLATVIGPLVGKNVAPYNPAGGLGNSAKNWWCSMKASEGKEATSNPDLARFDESLPMLGQDLMFPLAAVKFAGNKQQPWGGVRKMRQFPVSAVAQKCPAQLYSQAMVAAQVCSINNGEDMDLLKNDKGAQNCTLPDADVAHRVCNITCAHRDVICAQAAQQSKGEESSCQPKCWSLCSAVTCQLGAAKVWDGSRFLCWRVGEVLETYSTEFRLGKAVGQDHAWADARKHYEWRAKLSGGGTAALVLFLMCLAAVLGRLSAGAGFGGGMSMPTLDGGTFNEGSPTFNKVKEGLSSAGSSAAAVGMMIVALPVAAFAAISSRIQQYGGASGGISDTVNLNSSTETSGGGGGQTGDDYHAL